MRRLLLNNAGIGKQIESCCNPAHCRVARAGDFVVECIDLRASPLGRRDMLNSSRVYLNRFAAEAAASVPAGSRVLDAGAGEGPYRYTQFGFRHLLTSSGFETERLEWLEGYFGTLAYQFSRAARNLPGHPRHHGGGLRGFAMSLFVFFARPVLSLTARLFAATDLRARYTRSGHCKNYCAVARKPA